MSPIHRLVEMKSYAAQSEIHALIDAVSNAGDVDNSPLCLQERLGQGGKVRGCREPRIVPGKTPAGICIAGIGELDNIIIAAANCPDP